MGEVMVAGGTDCPQIAQMGADEGGLHFVHEGTRRRCALHEGAVLSECVKLHAKALNALNR